jgi:phosphoribosylanthranilate isomerase
MPMSVKVKICGLTNKDDATWAINYGADYLGVNFYKESPRHVSVPTAVKWVPQLPPFVPVIGVFVDETNENILKAIDKLNLKGVQLHGNETVEQIAALRIEIEGQGRSVLIIKAFRVAGEESLAEIPRYADVVDHILLDARVEGEMGGTGQRFNWDLALKAKEWGKPVFLAGGLTPENVKEAGKKVKPFAVDVASGVEKSPRKKDSDKIKSFIDNARGVR